MSDFKNVDISVLKRQGFESNIHWTDTQDTAYQQSLSGDSVRYLGQRTVRLADDRVRITWEDYDLPKDFFTADTVLRNIAEECLKQNTGKTYPTKQLPECNIAVVSSLGIEIEGTWHYQRYRYTEVHGVWKSLHDTLRKRIQTEETVKCRQKLQKEYADKNNGSSMGPEALQEKLSEREALDTIHQSVEKRLKELSELQLRLEAIIQCGQELQRLWRANNGGKPIPQETLKEALFSENGEKIIDAIVSEKYKTLEGHFKENSLEKRIEKKRTLTHDIMTREWATHLIRMHKVDTMSFACEAVNEFKAENYPNTEDDTFFEAVKNGPEPRKNIQKRYQDKLRANQPNPDKPLRPKNKTAENFINNVLGKELSEPLYRDTLLFDASLIQEVLDLIEDPFHAQVTQRELDHNLIHLLPEGVLRSSRIDGLNLIISLTELASLGQLHYAKRMLERMHSNNPDKTKAKCEPYLEALSQGKSESTGLLINFLEGIDCLKETDTNTDENPEEPETLAAKVFKRNLIYLQSLPDTGTEKSSLLELTKDYYQATQASTELQENTRKAIKTAYEKFEAGESLTKTESGNSNSKESNTKKAEDYMAQLMAKFCKEPEL